MKQIRVGIVLNVAMYGSIYVPSPHMMFYWKLRRYWRTREESVSNYILQVAYIWEKSECFARIVKIFSESLQEQHEYTFCRICTAYLTKKW